MRIDIVNTQNSFTTNIGKHRKSSDISYRILYHKKPWQKLP